MSRPGWRQGRWRQRRRQLPAWLEHITLGGRVTSGFDPSACFSCLVPLLVPPRPSALVSPSFFLHPHAPPFSAGLWAGRRSINDRTVRRRHCRGRRHPCLCNDGLSHFTFFFLAVLSPSWPQMFLGGTSKVYILDKVEGNAQQINGHSLYASVWYVPLPRAPPRPLTLPSQGH
jgi:hypothetical protein